MPRCLAVTQSNQWPKGHGRVLIRGWAAGPVRHPTATVALIRGTSQRSASCGPWPVKVVSEDQSPVQTTCVPSPIPFHLPHENKNVLVAGARCANRSNSPPGKQAEPRVGTRLKRNVVALPSAGRGRSSKWGLPSLAVSYPYDHALRSFPQKTFVHAKAYSAHRRRRNLWHPCSARFSTDKSVEWISIKGKRLLECL